MFVRCAEDSSSASDIFRKAIANREFKGDSVVIYQNQFHNLSESDTSRICCQIRDCFHAFDLYAAGDADSSVFIISEVVKRNSLPADIGESLSLIRFKMELDKNRDDISYARVEKQLLLFLSQNPLLSSRVSCILLQGTLSYRKGDLNKARNQFLYADSLLSFSLPKQRVKTLYWLGQVERLSSNLERSFQYYKKALEIAQRNNYLIFENKIKYAFGCFYHKTNQYQKAKEAYKDCIKGVKRTNQLVEKLRAIDGLAISLLFQDSIFEAHKVFHESLKLRKNNLDVQSLSVGLLNLGALHAHRMDIDSAQFYLENSLQLRLDNKLGGRNLLRVFSELGSVYLQQGQTSEALYLYNRALLQVDSITDRAVYTLAQKQIAKIYHDSGDFEQAAQEYQAYITSFDKLSRQQNTAKVAQVLAEYDSSQKDDTIDHLEHQINSQDYRNYVIYLPVLVLLITFSFYLMISRKKNIEKVREEERRRLETEYSRIEQQTLKKLNVNKEDSDYAVYIQNLIFEFEKNKVYLDPDLTISKLAGIIGSNNTYTSQGIKLIYDCSFPSLVNRKRIEESKALMVNSGMRYNVAQLSKKVGYTSESQYYRIFKELTGTTPRQYREKLKSDLPETNKKYL